MENPPGLGRAPGGFFVPYDRRVAKYTAEQLRKLADEGKAMPGGRYPIADREDLANAVHAVGRGKGSHAAIRAHIKKRAAALGAAQAVPDTWSDSGHDMAAFHDLGPDMTEVDDEERAAAYAFWDQLAEQYAREDGIERIGTWALSIPGTPTARLTHYWTRGEGAAKIVWGTKGAMRRCIAELSKYVHRSPGGLCADYHHIATGEWPTEHGKAGIPS